jgi:voltage-gated potassium channel
LTAPPTFRRRVWEILEVARPGDRPSEHFDIGIRVLIALNVLAVILETVQTLGRPLQVFFVAFEVFSVAVFTIEYMARVWSSVEAPAYRRPVRGRVRFALTPLALIDLLAVLPSLLPMLGLDLRVLRGMRLFRLFRILKLTRYSASLQTMGRVFRRAREPLIITLSATGLAVLIASAIMYYAEHAAQPELFSSIPAAMWWGVVTLTTLGYGDMYPITTLGRVMGGVFAVSGILLIALPTAILGAAFVDVLQDDDGAGRDHVTGTDHATGPDHVTGTDEAVGSDEAIVSDGDRCPACGQPVHGPVRPR